MDGIKTPHSHSKETRSAIHYPWDVRGTVVLWAFSRNDNVVCSGNDHMQRREQGMNANESLL